MVGLLVLAAGKAAEYVGCPSMNYSEAQQSVVRNLTRDLGEIALNGRPYRAEDFFTSLATGATTLEGSDSYTERIMNSAITSGKDYSLRQAINHGDIDPDELSKQMATGLAQGTMTELVHGYIDANHKVALNQRVDLKLEEEVGELLKEMFSAVDEDYRPNAKVGSGSTADALRYENQTGNLVGGKRHAIKARQQLKRIKSWLKGNPKASSNDKAAAEQVMLDMMEALGDI